MNGGIRILFGAAALVFCVGAVAVLTLKLPSIVMALCVILIAVLAPLMVISDKHSSPNKNQKGASL